LKYAYYSGCVAKTSGKELDAATRTLAERMGIQLVDFPEFSCCGGAVIDEADAALNIALNARNLAIAEAKQLPILTVCSTCQGMLSRANKVLRENKEMATRVTNILQKIGVKYRGGTEVKHLLQIIVEDFGLERLRGLVTDPLKGLKIAPFYGCHILRPADIVRFDDPWNPHSLEDLISALGAEPIKFKGRIECCGFPLLFIKESTANKMAGTLLAEAVDGGADLMVTPCPLCHISLDTFQSKAAKEVKKRISLPILHLPQLVGLALGIDVYSLGLSRHMVSVKDVLKKIGRH
jgi:succinate dehydrogenase / fumarate reductase cytochrome b subunit